MLIIVISGKQGTGKTTHAEQLQRVFFDMNIKARHYTFSQGLYDIKNMIDNKIRSISGVYFDAVKDRRLMQAIGQYSRNFDEDIWAKHLVNRISQDIGAEIRNIILGVDVKLTDVIIVSDMRFINEYCYLTTLIKRVVSNILDRYNTFNSILQSPIRYCSESSESSTTISVFEDDPLEEFLSSDITSSSLRDTTSSDNTSSTSNNINNLRRRQSGYRGSISRRESSENELNTQVDNEVVDVNNTQQSSSSATTESSVEYNNSNNTPPPSYEVVNDYELYPISKASLNAASLGIDPITFKTNPVSSSQQDNNIDDNNSPTTLPDASTIIKNKIIDIIGLNHYHMFIKIKCDDDIRRLRCININNAFTDSSLNDVSETELDDDSMFDIILDSGVLPSHEMVSIVVAESIPIINTCF